MASPSRRFLGSLSRFTKTRFDFPYTSSLISLSPFSTLEIASPYDKPPGNETLSDTKVEERFILDELSELLPISRSYSVSENYPEKKVGNFRAVDGFLLPEEKLRGVFLQKLRGNSAIEHALTNVGVDLTLDIVAKVVDRWNLGGEAMVTFFNWAMKQPTMTKDISSYNVIIKALGRRKFFEFMEGILHDLKKEEGVSPNLETFSIVMDSLIRARRVYKSIEMFGNSEEFGFKFDTESLNVLLHCLCRRSHVGLANSFMNKMKGKMPFNCSTYNIILGGWACYGRVSEMERNLKEMLEDGFNSNCSTFRCLVEGLGRAGRIEDAVEVFDSMKGKGCEPDTSVYNAMIYNFVSIGDFDGCMKFYKCLLSSTYDPDIDTYTKLITGLLGWRKVADALEIFDEMLGRGIVPRTGTITLFIKPLCSFGPPHAAMIFYKKARKVGCKISLTAYKLLLMRLARFGKCGMMLNIWEEMQESGHFTDMEVYEHVINGLCNEGQLENAVLVMEEALRSDFCPSRLICSKLNNKLVASNKVERAYGLFLKIKEARRRETAKKFWRRNGWHF
ncbi:Pentatricopeptide repeat (PPR) superfamily protein putative isoform 1 [Tripterygium wilfordii]|uniref:Pentatricopeptide repeat (PPR) superfamily protein putative isoform 1 n=1 Tax=Tripterygium wilfordii TaxID=458696 RepID=A0A7J7CAA9_TRIWF|nr:putative pentatricopeptide repeat-containing protein At5g43820 [Tripterygium wilfordii]XP_038685947.1 putative pentatricopeptide repeat-containing protein At5g43820 [Tripterygium wilfordii]XP_038685948.1 putative pentatricopeptide repeat-containing protein At5g43820 [Tripterygium wilfordii]XP_038685949.1 putative pentatricopeptide repeat-containing protein At5g43820 [Tripterygium wilfordii]KAF5731049.1 Pentatricopeptide repeat (PPR) superfamily protein putative isoform 1 [Tripterygium wilfor